MASLWVVCLAVLLLASVASSEPPVPSGYNYHRPSYSGIVQPSNSYLPPATGYTAPSNYLPPQSSYNPGSYDSGSSSHEHNSYDHGHGHESEVPKAYEFGYSVKDAQSGNDYNRHESSDGNVVRGEYRVALPDGRTQIVTYHADWQTGFHADVRYEGEARYPEPTPNQGYNYKAPSYTGSLTGFNNGNQYKPSPAYGAPGYH